MDKRDATMCAKRRRRAWIAGSVSWTTLLGVAAGAQAQPGGDTAPPRAQQPTSPSPSAAAAPTSTQTSSVTTASPVTGPTSGAAGGEHLLTIGEVVVTARRTSENLEKVPVAVTAFTGQALARQAIVSTQDLGLVTPSLTVTNSSANRDSAIYTIRGQGQEFGGSEPGVITYLAEVPVVTPGPGLLFDLQDVQILKGPQGTLFGRNTTGGAILFEPQHPKNEFGGYLDGTGGDYGLERFQGAVNIPIVSDKLIIRGAVDLNKRDGFTKDVLTGVTYDNRDYQSYRLEVEAKPIDGLDNLLILDYSRSDTNGGGTVLDAVNPAGPAVFVFPGLAAELAAQQARGPRLTEHSSRPGDDVKSGGIENITTYKINAEFTIKNLFGYRLYKERYGSDIDGSPYPIVEYNLIPQYLTGSSSNPSQKTYTDELQLQADSLGGKFKWILGIYGEYSRPTSYSNEDSLTQFGQGPFFLNGLRQERSRAIFAQGTYDLGQFIPGLKLTGGARYTVDQRVLTDSQYLGTRSICTLADGGANCSIHQSVGFNAPTGNVSLEEQITHDTLLYVASRRGYKSGGLNADSPSQDGRVFSPEYVTDVEIGSKTSTRIADIPVRLNADVYRGYYDNIQEAFYFLDAASGQELVLTRNAGAGVIQGLELEGTVIPIRHLELSGFYSYTDAYYTSNTIPGANGPIDLSSLPFPNVPINKFNINARYDIGLPPGLGDVSLFANFSYQSKNYFTVPAVQVNPNPARSQPGYGLLNVRLDWDQPLGHPLTLSFFMTNVTDKVYRTYESDDYVSAGFSSGIYGEPRMFGFEARYKLGGG